MLVGLSPSLGWAACAGQDIRASLSEAMQTEIADAVAATPYPTGNLWQATRADRRITLVGTVHIDDPRLDPIAANLNDRISAAEVVYLEMTQKERADLETRLATDPSMIVLPDGSLIDLLPEDVWQMLAQAASDRGLPGPMAARLQPWYLSLVLALPACLLADGETPMGLDSRIEEQAAAAAIPTRPLEPYDTLFKLFADEPLEVQLDMLAASAMDETASENMIATTLALYFEEAHATLWHLSRVAARTQLDMPVAKIDAMFADLEHALLIARNAAWIEVLEAAPETEIVAAFGAAHLFGETGVLALLEDQGYTLTRLTP